MTNWLTDWLPDWLPDWMNGWLTNWLTDWMNDWLINQVTDWLDDWMTEWLTGCRTDWMNDWLADQLTDWLTDRLTDWMNGWLTNWLTGWLTDWLSNWLTGWLAQEVDEKMAIHLVLMKWLVSWTKDRTTQSTEKPNSNVSTHLATAFDIIPMLDSRGGIDEWPADVWTQSCAVIKPFSATPILRIKDIKNKICYMQDTTSITHASWWFREKKEFWFTMTPLRLRFIWEQKDISISFLKMQPVHFTLYTHKAKGIFIPGTTSLTITVPSSTKNSNSTCWDFKCAAICRAPSFPETCRQKITAFIKKNGTLEKVLWFNSILGLFFHNLWWSMYDKSQQVWNKGK